MKYFCVLTADMFPREDSEILSVCPYPDKRNHPGSVNISLTLVIDTPMERSSRVLHNGNPKIWKNIRKSLKFEFWLVPKSWNHLSFDNVSPTLVIEWKCLDRRHGVTWAVFVTGDMGLHGLFLLQETWCYMGCFLFACPANVILQ